MSVHTLKWHQEGLHCSAWGQEDRQTNSLNPEEQLGGALEGSWEAISRVISARGKATSIVALLRSLLPMTHEPLSRVQVWAFYLCFPSRGVK